MRVATISGPIASISKQVQTASLVKTTIPKEVRAAANLKSGDRIHFTVLEDGTIIVRVKNGSIRDISFKSPGGKRVSVAQMSR